METGASRRRPDRRRRRFLGRSVAGGIGPADPSPAGSAAGQVWPAFVLVAGLLLVGLVAAEDGLFAVLGARLARLPGGTAGLVAGVAVAVAAVTAVLNLDTSVAFLSPILVHTARRRGQAPGPLLALCLLLSNAGSLLLPGSNLTNLIVLGGQSSGPAFASDMALPWLVAVAVTAVVSALVFRPDPGGAQGEPPEEPLRGWLGVVAVVAVVAAVLSLSNPALPVLAVGMAVVAIRIARRQIAPARAGSTVDLPVLLGLFGLAVALGTLGRAWTGLDRLLTHLGPWATAGVAAAASVLVNNLPAAAVLSARPPALPLPLLIGLNVGPNLFFTGSLAWVLWYGACRAAGAEPDLWRTVRAGLISAPLAGAAAVGMLLVATGQT